jgi:hypothetical protein
MLQVLIALGLFSSYLKAEFLITEVFGNALGAGRDDKKEWIELYNLSSPIKISSVTLEIYEISKNKEKLILSSRRDFLTPLWFKDFLLISKSHDLGINACFSIPVIVMPITIKNTGAQKICMVINQERTCAKFSKKSAMPDGISLFRDIEDKALEPLWRYEPCVLVDGIFASPGKHARFFCKINPSEHLACKAGTKIALTKAQNNLLPWTFTICDKKNLSICQILEQGIIMPKILDPDTFVLLETIDGHIEKRLIDSKIPIKIQKNSKGFYIEFNVLKTPVNVTLLKNKKIYLQQAYLKKGTKKIDFFSPDHKELQLKFSTIDGKESIFKIEEF